MYYEVAVKTRTYVLRGTTQLKHVLMYYEVAVRTQFYIPCLFSSEQHTCGTARVYIVLSASVRVPG